MFQVPTPFRVAAVSYLNAKPLLRGLESDPRIRLILDVPSQLPLKLSSGDCDAALLPVIDLQKLDDLIVLPAGGIGCRGPTLTVRIFSRKPIREVRMLAVDPDSHTSVALARVVLGEKYNLCPEIVPLDANGDADSILLIGDKVITRQPRGYPVQLDLGQAWFESTGLPFVFAVWAARKQVLRLGELSCILSEARLRGVAAADLVAAEFAPLHGWPVETARDYLQNHMRYEIGEEQLRAIHLFHHLAHRHGALADAPRHVQVWSQEPSLARKACASASSRASSRPVANQ
jgi:chorismate dehydratase